MAEIKKLSRRALPESAKSSTPKTTVRDFAKPWAKLCAAFPRYEIGAATLTVYHERLCQYRPDQIMAAVDLAIDSCTFFPSAAELINNIKSAKPPELARLPAPSAEEAKTVLENLGTLIAELEHKDADRAQQQAAERRQFLLNQARILGVSPDAIIKDKS